MAEKYKHGEYNYDDYEVNGTASADGYDNERDVFGHEENHDVSSPSALSYHRPHSRVIVELMCPILFRSNTKP